MDNILYKKKTQSCGSPDEKDPEVPSEALPNSVLESIARGRRTPTPAMLGRRENLAPSLQAKMQGAFGADFSGVEFYRSQTARDAGFNGIASGNKVALAPDIDLNSHAGQAVLGHELSHVVAQAQGIGGGRGFLGNASLERQADVQGERAASGMRAAAGSGLSMETSLDFSSPTMTAGGMDSAVLTPISASAGAFGMGAPMQGDKNKGDGENAQTALINAAAPAAPAASSGDVDLAAMMHRRRAAAAAQAPAASSADADLPAELRGLSAPALPEIASVEAFQAGGGIFGNTPSQSAATISRYEKMRQREVAARGDYHQHLYNLSHVGDEKTRSSSHDDQWKKNRAAWGAEAGEFVSNISPAEAMSLTNYTSQCGSYNDRMRNPNSENRRKMENQTDTLESALGKYKTKTHMKVYRVVDKKGIAAMMAGAGISVEPEMVEPNMLEGALLHDKGFMSTSVFPDLQWPGEFRLVIDIPAGSEVGAPLMDAHNTYSRDMDSNGDRGEFLMKPGLFLQVTGVEAVGGGNDMDRFAGFSYASSLTAKKSIVHCTVCSIPGGGLLR